MLLTTISSRFSGSLRSVALRLTLLLFALTLLPFAVVRGGVTFQPIFFSTAASFNAGDPLPCSIELEGGPQSVTVYSNPPGVVSYQGVVAASATVQAATNSSAVTGSVVIYVITDGQVVKSHRTRALQRVGGGGE